MSIHVMNMVWQHFQRGGSEKLALLALADWCDDQGGNLFPSIAAIAGKICSSESQARRIVHTFINEGLLEVVGNHNGGAPGQSRQYRLNIEKLTGTGSAYATPSMDATPSTHARDGLHGCARRVAPMTPYTSLTIKEPLDIQNTEKPNLEKRGNVELQKKKAGQVKPAKPKKTPLPDDFAISERVRNWAGEKGHSRLDEHFENFVSAARRKGYIYADWDEALMEAIRKDWAKINPVSNEGYVPAWERQ